LEEIIFENFNISENNIISVELAKVVFLLGCVLQLVTGKRMTIGMGLFSFHDREGLSRGRVNKPP